MHIKKLNVAKEVVKKKVPKETVVQKVTVESEIKRRRYTAFMSDLENAILYSLSHEVASRSSIVGPSLDALREYMDVLDKVGIDLDLANKVLMWSICANISSVVEF